MTSELKPCPFCTDGGEVELRECAETYFEYSLPVTLHLHGAFCAKCGAKIVKDSAEEAIAAWNQRAERTCTVEFYDNGWDALAEIEYADPKWGLSCGHSTYGVTKPCYCSECGAKVVE